MKNSPKLPRILKAAAARQQQGQCVVSKGGNRRIDCIKPFSKCKVGKKDPEYPLPDSRVFNKVRVHNQTLAWDNIRLEIPGPDGQPVEVPYEIDPDILYKNSDPLNEPAHRFFFGSVIRQLREASGLSQEELALRSGTSKSYLSRVENDTIEPGLTTLYKIIEIGLGGKLSIEVKKRR